ncbi:MAG: DNA-3-methyladenine glycosylase I [Termitinemataceae bacterium]|nr:MAG: DNA-3-methyladenine glycosylase I [Termitinemataceae bacterium]
MVKTRCPWCTSDAVYTKYHDEEWGVPLHDSVKLFEFLLLEGAQAGLSWITILKRRESYREAFDNFDPKIIANYDEAKIASLMQNVLIIRNKRKITSAINNAKCFLEMQREGIDFSSYLWSFVDNKPVIHHFKTMAEIPAKDEISEKLSLSLKQKGFSFVGPTIMYAFMQAVGMVNDHLTECFRGAL